jgi:hypothetical protein
MMLGGIYRFREIYHGKLSTIFKADVLEQRH